MPFGKYVQAEGRLVHRVGEGSVLIELFKELSICAMPKPKLKNLAMEKLVTFCETTIRLLILVRR